MSAHAVTLEEAQALPVWRRPVTLLFVMAAAMPIAFSTWSALLNNFVVDAAGFTGVEIGWLQSVREIPGFLAIGVVAVLLVVREQTLALVSLAMLGAAVAVTAQFPTFGGLLLTTLISSIGFHYYETVNQSLQLQWLKKAQAPRALGLLVAAGSAASLVAYLAIVVGWQAGWLDYNTTYMIGGGITLAAALYCWLAFPRFAAPVRQNTRLILRRRYWLYYALQAMAGARRQIFLVFAAFMMVERFGFAVHELTALFIINYVANMVLAPLIGGAIGRLGERAALVVEYTALALIFAAYGGIYLFGWGAWLAAALYVLDHLAFSLAIALKTYFQKIADPADFAPTAAVAFTINHIGAVTLPVALGYLWVITPAAVFGIAVAMALTSLGLACLIPRHPQAGHETLLARPAAAGVGHG